MFQKSARYLGSEIKIIKVSDGINNGLKSLFGLVELVQLLFINKVLNRTPFIVI